MAQKYRDALRKYFEFCSFLENGGKGVIVLKFCCVNLICIDRCLHLKRETVYSPYFPVMDVDKTYLRRFEQ